MEHGVLWDALAVMDQGPPHSLERNGLFAGHVHTSRLPDFRTWCLTIKYSRTVARLPPPPPPRKSPPPPTPIVAKSITYTTALSISPSLYLSLSLSLPLFDAVSDSVSVSACFCLSVSLGVCLSVSLSVSLSPSQSPTTFVYDSLPATPPLVILAFLHPPPPSSSHSYPDMTNLRGSVVSCMRARHAPIFRIVSSSFHSQLKTQNPGAELKAGERGGGGWG